MASIKRRLKRGNYKLIENKVTGNIEIFRKGSKSLVYTGLQFAKPESKIKC